jgi:hypothetical protein
VQSFDIDMRTGQLFIRKGASLDVNHLNGESIVFSVEVSNKRLEDKSNCNDIEISLNFLQASDGLYSALCDVNITLRDVNNHAPLFGRSHYITTIEENLPIGELHCSVLMLLVKCAQSNWHVDMKQRKPKPSQDESLGNRIDTLLPLIAHFSEFTFQLLSGSMFFHFIVSSAYIVVDILEECVSAL